MRRILLTTILALLTAITGMAGEKYVLVIDAGHGGKDAGAIGTYSKEKDINLKTALAFGRYVERNCKDVKVIYTRKTDVFLELYERANIANKNHADVFISIHTNSLPKGHISRGVETYSMTLRRSEEKLSAAMRENSVITYEKDYQQHYEGYDSNSEESAIMFEYIHDENMARSVELAKCIQQNICSAASRPSKGVKQDNFHVLRRTSMPACLVELGFISTPDEEALLNDNNAIDKMAYGIYAGFVKYKDKNSAVVPYIAPATTQTTVPTIVPQSTEQAESTDSKAQKRAEKKAQKEREKAAKEREKAEKEREKAEKAQEKTGKEPEKTDKAPEKAETREKAEKANGNDGKLTYRVQFLTSPTALKSNDSRLKGVEGATYYKEGNLLKYTVGDFTSQSDAQKLRRELSTKFPDAFIIKFQNGARVK